MFGIPHADFHETHVRLTALCADLLYFTQMRSDHRSQTWSPCKVMFLFTL
jgi:hypothetical protein